MFQLAPIARTCRPMSSSLKRNAPSIGVFVCVCVCFFACNSEFYSTPFLRRKKRGSQWKNEKVCIHRALKKATTHHSFAPFQDTDGNGRRDSRAFHLSGQHTHGSARTHRTPLHEINTPATTCLAGFMQYGRRNCWCGVLKHSVTRAPNNETKEMMLLGAPSRRHCLRAELTLAATCALTPAASRARMQRPHVVTMTMMIATAGLESS